MLYILINKIKLFVEIIAVAVVIRQSAGRDGFNFTTFIY